jgi:hypothetical protein
LSAINRNTGATYAIPSENEWYKAAYYKGGGTNAGYWTYPTQSNTAPGNALPDTGNNENLNDADPTNYLTPVGAYSASPGPYGTYDMGGDVFQWNEAQIWCSYGYYGGGLRGGCFAVGADATASSYRPPYWFRATTGGSEFGFRVVSLASVPLPGDANGDGRVDINDLTIVLTNFGQTGCVWSQGCMDGDPTGTVDLNDLTIVLANFGKTSGAGIAAVPEPSALVLIGLGVVGLIACTCRRRR